MKSTIDKSEYSSEITHPRLSIDTQAIVANWRIFGSLAPRSDIAAVVKSNGYGLGAVPISTALYAGGCRIFFCATVPECLEILDALPRDDDDIQVISLGGYFSSEILHYQKDRKLVPVLNTEEQLHCWRGNKAIQNRDVSIHIDTGMNRLGIPYQDWNRIRDLLDFPVHGLMSHLATADEAPTFADIQRQRFLACTDYPCSLVNTAGTFLGTEYHLAMIRLGIGLYGCTPETQSVSLNPVLHPDAPILQIRNVAPEETIGYGQTFRARTSMRIATVGIGYHDGLPRALNNHPDFSGYWQGQKLKICGRISMDSLAVDITDCPEITENSRVSFLNPQQGIDDLAKACNTIPHEALTRLGGRIQKIYTE